MNVRLAVQLGCKGTTMENLWARENMVIDDSGDYTLKPDLLEKYRESSQAQLDSWVAGNPVHNNFANECCPDFSCCRPELLWPENKRKAFAEANDEVRMEMLMGALNSVTISALPNGEVYIAGKIPENETKH